ncbi:MAG: transcription-repair coupling factor, partial [Bacillota bacterium]
MIKALLEKWQQNDQFIALANQVTGISFPKALISGLDGSARSFFTAALTWQSSLPALVITSDLGRAEKAYYDLKTFYPGQVNLLMPRELFVSTDVITRSDEQQQSRLGFLEWLNAGSEGIYVAPAAALIARSLPPDLWQELVIKIYAGMNCDREKLLDQLAGRGYERVGLTEFRTQFSARGDIIDIYPPGKPWPVRIELFDDTVESIRFYDPATQRSTGKLEIVEILPASELIVTDYVRNMGEAQIKKKLEKVLAGMRQSGDKEIASRLKQQVFRHLERLSVPEGLDILNSYYPFYYGEGASLIDYLPEDFLIFIEEPEEVTRKAADLKREYDDYGSSFIADGELLLPDDELLWNLDELVSRVPCSLVGTALFPGTGGLFKPSQLFSIETKNAPYYHGQWDLFKKDYQGWVADNYQFYLVADEQKRGVNLLEQILADDRRELLNRSKVLTGNLEEGFIIPALQLAVLNERNLLPLKKKKRRLKQDQGIRLSDYRELNAGDYVVHEQHGIGRYTGLDTLEVGGGTRDYLVLKYRGTDRLYIPVDQVGLIQKYSGGDGPSPRLHSLGGGEWQRLKKRVNRSVEELARELLALYAARQAVEGYRFGSDHLWQREFEANFPFEETPDQKKAIENVKADMEKSTPMDRLVCGDVGYGKTEVAMRAAFKAVMEGKQVVFLVPTTVLAQQHYRTFRERFEGFPVRVEQLSRFVTPANQKNLIKDLKAGKIDIVVGTHRLLSKDVAFSDLGLLVIDEEQRFGVRQKEKMKQLRLEVDTLAMTATPIPRTLHLSLAGARDFSIIDTPPEDRYPIQTYVLEYSENLVRDAVQRELSRCGQVFIVYNRVESIDRFAESIKSLFPEVKVVVAHGQMPESQLEKVMTGFQDGEYQVLVSSTIIESGLDIPNVNTLIIYEADRLGLAQLYQIRGRVGRSSRIAYAYLTYRKEKIVSETARKRLKAIKEFTELGSGFKIALQDLEIRGAGNILGAEQHGFITAIGFDLYVRLLDRAVAELKNEKHEPQIEPRLELRVNAHLPSVYISAQEQKVDLYQRIYSSSSEELAEINEELTDRFGVPPEPVKNLLQVAGLRLDAAALGIELITQQQADITVQFAYSRQVDADRLKEQLSSAGYCV